MVSRTAKFGLAALALSVVTALSFDMADARPGKSGSVGSRGDRTFSAPPATTTAPKGATGIDKTMTQPGKATTAASAASATNAAAATSRFGSMGGMMKGLLLGGLMGAAFASIFGAGALASALGFILQTLLIGGLIFLAISFFRNRMSGNKPAMATAAAGPAKAQPETASYRQATAPIGGGNELTIAEADFTAFQRLLGEVQDAYGRADIKALGDRMTPEMLSYFAGELDANKKQGVRNEVSSANLLQGDLAESWREVSGEYATVAMRYSLLDATVDVASGKVISGSKTQPEEVTEIWTFRRPRGGRTEQWELSAIQQAA